VSDGSNAAKGLPGYKKTLTEGYLPELYNAPTPAPPTAGLPWAVGGYEYNPLIEDRPSPPPPEPDRYLRNMRKCGSCGAAGFSTTDAAKCPECGAMQQAVTPTYTPGTPWF
jgi:hypothetical protein